MSIEVKEIPGCDIKNLELADTGEKRVLWAFQQMPVLRHMKEVFLAEKKKPLEGIKIAACLHVTTETANLMTTLQAGGAEIALCASNPLSTQDDVAAYLVKQGISVYAIKGEDNDTYYSHINSVLDIEPNITMDDGADLVSTLHTKRKDLIKNIIGGTEETTTGVIRLRSMEKDGSLEYPIIAVNEANTKHLFDNRYGTGQSSIDGIIRATNTLIAGKQFVVAGYGWCGRGLAMRARGMGARVIVTEIDPMKALEAVMDGFYVLPMKDAARIGDIFCTVTGNIHVIRKEHFEAMKSGAIVCNSGHFNVELDIPALKELSSKKRNVRPFLDEYTLEGDKKVYLLADGRLVNLSAAEGHPAQVMDLSFANQTKSVEFIVNFPKNNGSDSTGKKLENKVYKVPELIDNKIAALKLKTMNLSVDTLTAEQKEYMESWTMGT